MAAPASPEAIRDVNTRYHDAAAEEYDYKWGIDFHEIGQAQVLGKLRKALGRNPGPFPRALEIGSGTGYFSLNLLRAGVVRHATATDISPGMLATLRANADRLGIGDHVETVVTDAERLPFEDESFDLVFGHAVLHHQPDLDRAFSEFLRVLRPGGTLFFAGEPSRHGDRIAAYPKRGATARAPGASGRSTAAGARRHRCGRRTSGRPSGTSRTPRRAARRASPRCRRGCRAP